MVENVSQMDHLEIEVNRGKEFGPDDILLSIKAVINGGAWPKKLDVDVFFDALTRDGRLPLFTCGCGVFECGGYYVDVSRTRAGWTWRNRYAPNNPEHADHATILEPIEVHFSWANVRAAAGTLLAALQTLRHDTPTARLTTSISSGDLSSHLARYDEQAQALAREL